MSDDELESFLVHARNVISLDGGRGEKIRELVSEAIERYRENWSEYFDGEADRLQRILDHLDKALAAVLSAEWSFSEDDPYAPFHDEASALQWLSGEGENSDAGEPNILLDESDGWTIRSLWEARKKIDAELENHISGDKVRGREHWARLPETKSRLPEPLQELINDLCQIWHDYVDPQLGLPRRDPRPDNPLLRFVDACLALALGDQRPAKKALLHFIGSYIRNAIRAEEESSEPEVGQAQLPPQRVDLEPFPHD